MARTIRKNDKYGVKHTVSGKKSKYSAKVWQRHCHHSDRVKNDAMMFLAVKSNDYDNIYIYGTGSSHDYYHRPGW